MKTVFLYAGQGSQRVGMGLDFYQNYASYQSFVDSLELDFDFKKLMAEGPMETLSVTKYTQPCMSAFAAGVTNLLLEHGVKPQAACGLSLGEYGALYAAGVFDAKDYIALTAFRGDAMHQAAEGCQCSMSAILGLDSSVIEKACQSYDGTDFVTVANYNCPGQCVICGDESAVCRMEEILKELGAKRCVRLKVSGPFHTKYMKAAGESLGAYLQKMALRKPEIPVALNVTGDFYNREDSLCDLLVRQIQNSVRMEDELRLLLKEGYDRFIEIGPGNTMAGFLKKTAREMQCEVEIHSIDTVEDFKKLIGE